MLEADPARFWTVMALVWLWMPAAFLFAHWLDRKENARADLPGQGDRPAQRSLLPGRSFRERISNLFAVLNAAKRR